MSRRRGVVRDGFAFVDERIEIGLGRICVPRSNGAGKVVAAINVSEQAGSISRENLLRDILPVLQQAAESVRPALI